jgi:hypothetical protein
MDNYLISLSSQEISRSNSGDEMKNNQFTFPLQIISSISSYNAAIGFPIAYKYVLCIRLYACWPIHGIHVLPAK